MRIKISEQGNIIEVTRYVCGVNTEPHIKKISADEYVRLEDGEVCEFQHIENRSELKIALCRTFRKIRSLINANFTGEDSELFITLTYAENMTDTVRLLKDFERFWKRFKRRWGGAEYISVIEPRGRGAWHVHLIAIWEGRAPYIPNAELRDCWGHGFVRVNAVRDDCDNLGAYLSAYLADVEVPEDGEGVEKQVNGTTKKFKKRGRLHMYPAHMQIYRTSRGIERPEVFWADEKENTDRYESLTEGREPVYEREITFKDDEGREHRVVKQQYNLIRSETK
jgi:hypothetical protein